LQSVRGRCGRRERDERQDHPQTIRTELDPVDYRLEQISSSGIGQQALPQALCFSHMMREYRPMAAPFVDHDRIGSKRTTLRSYT